MGNILEILKVMGIAALILIGLLALFAFIKLVWWGPLATVFLLLCFIVWLIRR